MTPSLLLFINWIAIIAIVITVIRLAIVIFKLAIWSEHVIHLVDVAWQQGKIKRHPLHCGYEFIILIVSILWIVIM